MPWSLRWSIALRQTLDPGRGLSAFLSRVSIVGMALAIALLLAVQSVMNGFDREMRERILSLVPHVQVTDTGAAHQWADITATLEQDPAVSAVRRFIRADALLMRGQSVSATQLTGVDAAALSQYARLLSPAQIEWSADSLVLGSALASRLGLTQGDRVTFILPGEGKAAYQSAPEWRNELGHRVGRVAGASPS